MSKRISNTNRLFISFDSTIAHLFSIRLNLLILLILTFLQTNSVVASDLDQFTTLRSEGLIPSDFLLSSREKSTNDFEAATSEELDRDFYISTRFFIDHLLLSGKVTFNDPVSNYIKRVAAYILKDDTLLFNQLRFYTVKTTEPNAFATDQGIIFVTTGLVARLESEAQLAFVLAHEISHYTSKHVQAMYLKRENLFTTKGKYTAITYDGAIRTLNQYSRKHELEADKKAIELYRKTNYNGSEIFTGFDMLLTSHIPFSNDEVSDSIFNSELMTIPASYFPVAANEVELEDDITWSDGTHPTIYSRKLNILEDFDTSDIDGTEKFHFAESEFIEVQNLARFENINLQLSERNYISAIYDILMLQKLHKKNRFLDLCFIKALYGLVVYSVEGKTDDIIPPSAEVQGESSRLYGFFEMLTPLKTNVVALRLAYDLCSHHPGDHDFEIYLSEINTYLARNPDLPIYPFRAESIKDYAKMNFTDSLGKIDLEAMFSDPFYKTDFHLFSLSDFIQEDRFPTSKVSLFDSIRNLEKAVKLEPQRNVVIVDPIYENYNINQSKDEVRSERIKMKFSEYYIDNYKNLKLQRKLLDSKNFDSSSVDAFNDLAQINDWIYEISSHDLNIIPSCRDRMDDLEVEYGTSEFLFSGFFSYKDKPTPTLVHLLFASTIYMIPLVTLDLLIYHDYLAIVAFTINSKTNEGTLILERNVNLSGDYLSIRPYVYEILYKTQNIGFLK